MAEEESGEKTEEPTPKRLAQARRRGEIAKSRDLTGAAVLVALFAAVTLGAASAIGQMTAYWRTTIVGATNGTSLRAAGAAGLDAAVGLVALPLGAAILGALGAGFLQARGLITLDPLSLEARKLIPSFKRVFSAGALLEVAKGLAKTALVAVVAWSAVPQLLKLLVNLPGANIRQLTVALGWAIETVGFRLVFAAAVLGAADYLLEWHRHRKSMMMTRQQVKREHKESEGDPHHKAERHRLHRELLEQRMVQEVRKADFVVVNPDHIAVALRYDRDAQMAPVVIAKGERLLAERIKEIAREAGVPIFRDVTLARSLKDLEEGDEIPEALYEAVAEILRIVYGTCQVPDDAVGASMVDRGGEPEKRPDPAGGSTWRRV